MLYIPLMKELGMSLEEIKSTPRYELEGLLRALSNFNTIHAFNGQSEKDVSEAAKQNPQVRADYQRSLMMREKYDRLIGKPKKKVRSFTELLG